MKRGKKRIAGSIVTIGLGILLVVFFITIPHAADAARAVSNLTPDDEKLPAVAANTDTGNYLVAYLLDHDVETDEHYDVLVKRYNSAGGQEGEAVSPLGALYLNYTALAGPQIAFNSSTNQYLLAVPVKCYSTGKFSVLAQFFDGNGNLLGSPIHLFDEQFDTGYFSFSDAVEDNQRLLDVTANTALNEFLVTASMGYPDAGCTNDWRTGVWGQRVEYANNAAAKIDTPKILLRSTYESGRGYVGTCINSSADFLIPHSVAHAPVGTPAGGRYLVVAEARYPQEIFDPDIRLFNSTLGQIGYLMNPDLGNPADGHDPDSFDVAYGSAGGVARFLVVYTANNCCDGNTTCEDYECLGAWGITVDPLLEPNELYHGISNVETKPFPITYHYSPSFCDYAPGYFNWYSPRVTYNPFSNSFFVAWTEYPHENTAETCPAGNHIRGREITSLNYDPYTRNHVGDPVVLSDISGDIVCTDDPFWACISDENPTIPSIAPSPELGAVVVWQQNNLTAGSTDQDVFSNMFHTAENSSPAAPASLGGTSGTVQGSLFGAANDGSAGCGNSAGSRDVWYRFEAPEQGLLKVNTCGSHDLSGGYVDTVLSLHYPDGNELVGPSCNDDYLNGLCTNAADCQYRDSAISWYLAAGDVVLVRVSHFSTAFYPTPASAAFVLNYDFMPTNGDGLPGSYYRSAGQSGGMITFDTNTFEMERIDPRLEFVDYFNPFYAWQPIAGYPDNYGVSWHGYLRIEQSGEYGFGTISDDGSQVFIDGELVVDNHELQYFDWEDNISEGSYVGLYPLEDGGTDNLTGPLYLARGCHEVEVLLYDDVSFDGLVFSWLRSGAGASNIPFIGHSYGDPIGTFYYNGNTNWEVVPQNVLFSDCDECLNGLDTDGDGILDEDDLCPGFDDVQDSDGDGIPDGCDVCPFSDNAASPDCNGNNIPDPCDLDNHGYFEDFSDPGSSNITLNGSAVIVDGACRLTEAVDSQMGTVLLEPVSNLSVTDLKISFDFRIGGGTGADGMSFALLDSTVYDSTVAFGEEGPGGAALVVKFNTYWNETWWESSDNSIVLIQDGVKLFTAEFDPADLDLNDYTWRHVDIEYYSDGDYGYIDMVMTSADGVNRNVIGAVQTAALLDNPVFAGFGARTGGLNDEHWVDNILFQDTTAGNDCNSNSIPDDCESTADSDNDGIPDICDSCIDVDGDGFGAVGDVSCPGGGMTDCDDGNRDVYPGAPEICDGIDNDCNGLVDDGISCNTPPNSEPQTISNGDGTVEVTFPVVTEGGETTITETFCTDYRLWPSADICVDIDTTATFEGPVTICFHYDEAQVKDENNLRMVHCDENGLNCEPITPFTLDTINNVICAEVAHLSIFSIGDFNPADLDVDNDVDGKDLHLFTVNDHGIDLEFLAGQLGTVIE